MRHSDPHDRRKWKIESEMLAGRNPPRIMSEPIRATVDILRARFPQPDKIPSHNLIHQAANELEKALADSALKTVRILELEKELAEALDSLRGLHDEQNGAPTFRRQENWQFEMLRAESLLLKHNK